MNCVKVLCQKCKQHFADYRERHHHINLATTSSHQAFQKNVANVKSIWDVHYEEINPSANYSFVKEFSAFDWSRLSNLFDVIKKDSGNVMVALSGIVKWEGISVETYPLVCFFFLIIFIGILVPRNFEK